MKRLAGAFVALFLSACAASLGVPSSAVAFEATAAGTVTLSASTSSSRVNIQAPQGAARVYNAGPATVFLRAGGSAVSATTTTDMPVVAGATETIQFHNTDGSAAFIAGITASSTASVYITIGDGVSSGYGGGSGGSDATAANQVLGNSALDAIKIAVEFLAALGYTPPDDATASSVNDAATSTVVLASNVNRQGGRLFNDSPQVAYCLEDEGTASATNFTIKMDPGGFYNLPVTSSGVYTDQVSCIWAANDVGAMRVTEITP